MEKNNAVPFSQVEITGGFWKERQLINENVTLDCVRKRFEDTGRFDAFKFSWKPGEPNRPHIFYDSDVAKWMESAAYVLRHKRDAELEAYVDSLVDLIEEHIGDDGYFNVWFTVVCPEDRFTNRGAHELYCAGHLFEAAVAYYEATGKEKFLRLMCRYADYIERVFKIEDSAAFTTPGHPEIELALVRLYRCTGEKRYLELSRFFVDMRGNNEKDRDDDCNQPAGKYQQDHLPLREQRTAEGHSVRACYIYSAMADIAHEYGDTALFEAAREIFSNIVGRRMYITGGIGSTHCGEAFTVDYDLPNETAYAETCAAISLAMFAGRMSLLEVDSRYADTAELVMYNGFLSGVSLDGRSFFYENPLSIDLFRRSVSREANKNERLPITQRLEVFECSCCPPNVTRFVESIGNYLYSNSDSTVYVHQYMDSEARFEVGEKQIEIIQETDYPSDGSVRITFKNSAGIRAAVRIPGWCKNYEIKAVNASECGFENGYAVFECDENAMINIEFDMTPTLVTANPLVRENAGRAAVMRGPVVYCAEGVDNENVFSLALSRQLNAEVGDGGIFGLPVLDVDGFDSMKDYCKADGLYNNEPTKCSETRIRLIPYYAFANRGESDMQVWLNIR